MTEIYKEQKMYSNITIFFKFTELTCILTLIWDLGSKVNMTFYIFIPVKIQNEY